MPENDVHGSCVCGAIAYAVHPPFIAFQYCHCSRCRKGSGSAHAANLFVATDQFRWTKGEEHARVYDLPSAKYWRNGFCDICGSAVPYLSRTGKAVILPAGSLDEEPGERPDRNIMWASRAPWYVHASELDTFDEYPPRKG
jgi:hypothetical protein